MLNINKNIFIFLKISNVKHEAFKFLKIKEKTRKNEK
jgi:hypothetical protein